MLWPSTSIISSCDCSAWPSERGSHSVPPGGSFSPRAKAAFSLVALLCPPSCALQPLPELLGASALLGMKGGTLQPAKSPLFHSEAADSSPAPYKARRMHMSQNSYAGSCETAVLQKLGLVMSFLTTDPCVCHSSRMKHKRSQQSSSYCVFFCQPRLTCC